MPRRRLSRPAVEAILRSIENIDVAMKGKSFDAFSNDWLLKHGVQRGIEIISEATRRLPDALLASHPEIAWATYVASVTCCATTTTRSSIASSTTPPRRSL